MVNEAVRFLTVAERLANFMDPKAEIDNGGDDHRRHEGAVERVEGRHVQAAAHHGRPAGRAVEDSKSACKNWKVDATKMEEERRAWVVAEKLAVEAAKAVGIPLFVENGAGWDDEEKALQLFRGS
jgi:hypothetical protein